MWISPWLLHAQHGRSPVENDFRGCGDEDSIGASLDLLFGIVGRNGLLESLTGRLSSRLTSSRRHCRLYRMLFLGSVLLYHWN